ncbi:AAA domain-containing protein [candidate division KSB1 bacterium]|nr:AAA domain-containing protein [candidate division KSB1 bacterium]
MSENKMRRNGRVIAVGSEDDVAKRLELLYRDQGVKVFDSPLNQIIAQLESDSIDVVVLTSSVIKKSREKWRQFFNKFRSSFVQLVLLADPEDMDLAIKISEEGNYQYSKVPVYDRELKALIERAMKARLIDPAKNDAEEKFGQIIGRSQAMRQVYRQIELAASNDIHVLLLGETGTGKDITAQTIHELSQRQGERFIPVNLAALPGELVASELFGHEKGAFTGADRQSKGKFELAEKGTVFLDEIGSVSDKIQVSLLRLLEQQEFYRLGGKDPIKSNCRIIAASNEDLEKMVQENRFREDLFYRLDVFRIFIPPLHQRPEDIHLLVFHFVDQYNRDFNKKINDVSADVLQIFEEYDWPGNVRELKNVIQRAVLMCNSKRIQVRHLPQRFKREKPGSPTIQFTIGTPLEEIEHKTVVRALEMAQNNRTRAAELLGISRRALYNKMDKYGI